MNDSLDLAHSLLGAIYVVSRQYEKALAEGERAVALRQAYRLLVPGGLLLVADEVVPDDAWRRVLHGALRLPLALLTYVLTQTTSRALKEPRREVESSGFVIKSYQLNRLHSFAEIVARAGAP